MKNFPFQIKIELSFVKRISDDKQTSTEKKTEMPKKNRRKTISCALIDHDSAALIDDCETSQTKIVKSAASKFNGLIDISMGMGIRIP